ncbi:MAG: hypothetical protein KatS3mg028_0815 [Bacteroidia bacterium]|nr:MAG: hypothetical protein KatS3mg028_0815 [Bacteroidia bacterium]
MNLKLSFVFILTYIHIYTQNISKEYTFALKLINENKLHNTLHLLKLPNHFSTDTLNYLKGLCYYHLKKPDSTAFFLQFVKQAELLPKAGILTSINLSYLNKYQESIEVIKKINPSNADIFYIKNILLTGNYLILKNYPAVDSVLKIIDTLKHYKYSGIVSDLKTIKNNQIQFKKKSPFVAGILSTFVPGLGKLYAGRKGEAMSMFIANIVMAGFTFESYYRTKNISSPQVITFGTLFTFFYSGNIIGSIHSARRQNLNKQKQIKNEILANMHLAASNVVE